MRRIATTIAALAASGAIACTSLACATPTAPPADEGQLVEATAEQPDAQQVPQGFKRAQVAEVLVTREGPAVLLTDADKQVVMPIFVGGTEAMAITLRHERRRYQRPLTHDLLDAMVQKLGGKILKVHIDGVKGGVFVGRVFLDVPADGVTEIDARPSDAIALALGNGVPIYVKDEVFQEAGITKEQLEQAAPPEGMEPPRPPTKPL